MGLGGEARAYKELTGARLGQRSHTKLTAPGADGTQSKEVDNRKVEIALE